MLITKREIDSANTVECISLTSWIVDTFQKLSSLFVVIKRLLLLSLGVIERSNVPQGICLILFVVQFSYKQQRLAKIRKGFFEALHGILKSADHNQRPRFAPLIVDAAKNLQALVVIVEREFPVAQFAINICETV